MQLHQTERLQSKGSHQERGDSQGGGREVSTSCAPGSPKNLKIHYRKGEEVNKWAGRINRHLSKEDTQNDTQVSGEMFNTINQQEIQVKTSMRDSVTSFIMATSKETVANTCWWGHGEGQICTLCQERESVQPSWKALSTNQPDPGIPIPHARGCQGDTCNLITETLFSVAKQPKQ